MYDIEHPDITHVNRTGYTREQWWDMKMVEHERDRDDRDETEKE